MIFCISSTLSGSKTLYWDFFYAFWLLCVLYVGVNWTIQLSTIKERQERAIYHIWFLFTYFFIPRSSIGSLEQYQVSRGRAAFVIQLKFKLEYDCNPF